MTTEPWSLSAQPPQEGLCALVAGALGPGVPEDHRPITNGRLSVLLTRQNTAGPTGASPPAHLRDRCVIRLPGPVRRIRRSVFQETTND